MCLCCPMALAVPHPSPPSLSRAVLFVLALPVALASTSCAAPPPPSSPAATSATAPPAAPSASAAPPPATPIVTWHGYPPENPADDVPDDEANAQLRKDGVFFRAEIARQGRDEPWATQVEQTTFARGQTPHYPGVKLEGIQCARTLCAVVFSAPDREQIAAAALELRELVPGEPGSGYSCAYDYRMRQKGRSFATVFMTRMGVPLPMPPR